MVKLWSFPLVLTLFFTKAASTTPWCKDEQVPKPPHVDTFTQTTDFTKEKS
jgi:hypothetical protein